MSEGPSAVVQEVAASERVVVLEVRVPGLTSLVLVAATQTGGGVAVLSKGLRQELWAGKLPPGAPRQRAREDALVKARLLAIEDAQVIFEPWSSRSVPLEDGREWPAMARALRIQSGRVVVTDVPWPRDAPDPVAKLSEDRDALEARGRSLAASLADDAIEQRRTELARALEKARARIERRRAAIREDLSKIAKADVVAAQAQWLIGVAKRTPRGAKELVATDWSSGEAQELRIPLDPAKSASDQVEAMFKRAKRLKLGGRIASDRLAQADAQAGALVSAAEALRAATSLVELENAAREAKKSAPRDVALPGAAMASAASKAPKPAGRVAYRTFLARSGATLLVGKGAADNDTLTLKVARPHDLWLHAKDRTGAHVIAPLAKGHTCPPNDLVDAAHLAAHFSDARDEKIIDVQYTPKRYLRKPKGSAPGAVIVDREKVMALRMEPAVLRELLEREEV